MCRSTVIMVGSFVAVVGCAPATSQLSGAAVEGAVESVGERDTRQELEDFAESPEFGRAVQEVGEGITRGAMAGLEHGPIELEPTIERIGASLVRGVESELVDIDVPSARALTGEVVDGALAHAASGANRERARLLVGDMTDTMVRRATASFADGVEQDILPMFDGTRRPTLASLVGDEAPYLAGAVAFEISRQSTLGVEEAMSQIATDNRERDEGLLGRMSMVGWAVLISALLLLLGAIVLIIVLAVRNRRTRELLREDSREREQLLVTLVAGLAGREGFDERLHTALTQFLGRDGKQPGSPPTPPPEPPPTEPPPLLDPLTGHVGSHVRHG